MFDTKPRAVLFDMDGVLLDTERFYTEVTQQIVARYGKTFGWEQKQHMVGRPAIESARYLVEELELPITAEDYLREREGMLRQLFPTAEPMPGAREFSLALADRGVPTAVATSSSRELFELKTQRHTPWFERFRAVIVGDDPRVKRGKPAPDIFLVAAEAAGVAPADCLVVEDAPSGVAAARSAGMRVLGVPYPGMNPELLAEADVVLESLERVSADEIV